MFMFLSRTLLLAAAATTLSTAALAQAPAAPAAPAEAPAAEAPAATPAPPETVVITPNPSADIVANLKASGQFKTLVAALEKTNLAALLADPNRKLTLFAPTDAAFAALPPGTLDNWMKQENATAFQRAIAYHMVNADVTKDKVEGSKGPIPSVINTPINVDGSNGAVKVNEDATVLQAGVTASNGSIYVVDKVLQAPAA
jgi:uncharacterized surface protein with fasciclin (FAS1) repeats